MHHVPDGTGVEVLAWVGEDLERAAVALAREEQREKPRRTLMRSLSDLQQQE